MSKARKHAEIIKQWADDSAAIIEWRRPPINNEWRECYGNPSFDVANEYRVRTEKPYPVTQMDHAHLIAAYGVCGYDDPAEPNSLAAQGYERIANAALRHAIDAGQVVPVSEAKPGVRPHNPYTGQLRDQRDIEIDPMGMLFRHPGEPLRPEVDAAKERDARDMAIALAVRSAAIRECEDNAATITTNAVRHINLADIIASVPK